MTRPIVQFVQRHPEAKLPVYSTAGAAGADVHSVDHIVIGPGSRALVQTGLDCVIPAGYELQVRPRSGLAFKNKITVLNSPGTIDEDYRGALGVLLINHGVENFVVNVGDRIAQIVVAPVMQAVFGFIDEDQVEATLRGAGGFGSTGVGAKA